MAQYTPSFVNLSGATEALVNAYDRAAQMKYQQDQVVQAQIDDFQKNYNPNKLRDQDLPAFTNAFKQYKEAALRYSRLNRGGGKPEEVAVANTLKDKALNEMNDLYRKSTVAAGHQAEYADYIRNARLRGYSIPQSVNDVYMGLNNSSIKDINTDNIPSAWSNPLVAQEVDYDKLSKFIDANIGKQQSKSITYKPGTYLGKTAGGKDLYGKIPVATISRDANKTSNALQLYASAHPEVDNAAKESYEQLALGLQNGDESSIQRFNTIKTTLGLAPTATIKDINKYQVLGSNFYLPTTVEGQESFKEAEFEADREKEAFDRQYKMSSLAAKGGKGESTFEHPSATINKITDSYDSYSIPTQGNIESWTPKTGDKDVTREFSSYVLPNAAGGKTGFKNVLYNKGGRGVDPFITYTTYDEPSSPKYSSLEQFNQLLVKTAPDVTFKGSQKIKKPVATTTKAEPEVSQTVTYIANGKRYIIPAKEVGSFLKSFPDAKKQ